MDTTASESPFGAGRLFLTDARLALILGNHARYLLLRRLFGVSREQANLLTFVVAVGAADAGYQTMRRLARAPHGPSGTDVAIAGAALREAALGVAGVRERDIPMFGTLLTLAMFGAPVVVGLRWATRNARATERRIRARRIDRYSALAGTAPAESARR
jgi:predicted nucleic acid-binding protein